MAAPVSVALECLSVFLARLPQKLTAIDAWGNSLKSDLARPVAPQPLLEADTHPLTTVLFHHQGGYYFWFVGSLKAFVIAPGTLRCSLASTL